MSIIMNYGTQSKPNGSTAGKQSTAGLTTQPEQIPESIFSNKRCSSSFKGKKEIGTQRNASDGLLKSVLKPKIRYSSFTGEVIDDIESGFFESLSKVADYYGFRLDDDVKFEYPVNIAMAKVEMDNKIQETTKGYMFTESKILTVESKTYIQITESVDLKSTLYYIPILPVYNICNDSNKKETGNLLLSLFCYLRNIVGVQMYSDDSGYLYWHYEMLKDWILEDESNEVDEEEHKEAILKIQLLEKYWVIGNELDNSILNHKHLRAFRKRVSTFKPVDDFDRALLKLANLFLSLYQKYPKRNIYENGYIHELEKEEDDYSMILQMNKMISFIPTANDIIYGWIEEAVNNEFNECEHVEEPTIFRDFDGREQSDSDLKFEGEMFELIDQLCGLLNDSENG